MLQFSDETKQAILENQFIVFITFDFELSPMYVHSGEGERELKGRQFQGLGHALKFKHKSTAFTRKIHTKGAIEISLPMSVDIEKIFQQKTYVDRKVTCELFAIDNSSNLLNRVLYCKGKIFKDYALSGDSVILTAYDDTLDSQQQKDNRHKEKITEIRSRFNRQMGDLLWKSLLGIFISLILGSTVDPVVGLASILLSFWFIRNLWKQRISARKRVFWIKTEPKIPRKWKRKHGYKVHADTLEEANEKLHFEIIRKIWLFPREWRMIIIRPQNYHMHLFSLEDVRLRDNPKRCKETDPMQMWLENDTY